MPDMTLPDYKLGVK